MSLLWDVTVVILTLTPICHGQLTISGTQQGFQGEKNMAHISDLSKGLKSEYSQHRPEDAPDTRIQNQSKMQIQ